MTLLATNEGSGVAESVFDSQIDSTYKLYIFKFIDINPVENGTYLMFNGSIDGGSNYNVTKTTTDFWSYHQEDDGAAALLYALAHDLAQSTAAQQLSISVGNGADESCAGTLWLFNPSNTTYVKHFYSRTMSYEGSNAAWDVFVAGYFNDTNNIDAVQFAMNSDSFDGTIKMYGVG